MDLKGAERFKRAMPPCEAYWVLFIQEQGSESEYESELPEYFTDFLSKLNHM